MINKVIKLVAAGIIIALLVGLIYPPIMPDFMKHSRKKAANVSAKQLTVKVNETNRERAYKIIDFLDKNGTVTWTKSQLEDNFKERLSEKEFTIADVNGTVDSDMGYVEWSRQVFKDSCADGLTIDSDVEGVKKDQFEDFTYVLDGNLIYWYCKEHKELSAVSPYKLWEMPWCKEAESLFPGIGEWVRSVEENGYEVETKDHEKVHLIMNDLTEDAHTKSFNGFTVTLRQQDAVITMRESELYDYEGLTDLYMELQKSGWLIKGYYINGEDKGFACTAGFGDYAPLAKLTVAAGKITRIDLSYCDYKVIDTNRVEEYQTALAALFKKAGIDDSVKDVLNDKGKQKNYRVYTKAGEKSTDYRESKPLEFDTFMVSIYDIL